jgi:hypothetical protein
MKKKNFEFDKKFFNFMYQTLSEKLASSTEVLTILNDQMFFDERVLDFWGDFFEQVLGVDRNEVLEKTYQRLSRVLSPEMKLTDPLVKSLLYQAEIANLCGDEVLELEFDDIYEPRNLKLMETSK